jgi:ribosomal protein S18 acetylase RimI-like enzyme
MGVQAEDGRNMTGVLKEDLIFDMAVSSEREAYLEDRIIEFNRTHCELWEQNRDSQYKAAPLHVYALDQQGEVIGGLTGRTHSLRAWLEISVIWVKPGAREQGIGRKLMKRAEEEALSRGCLYARTSTSDYQAPRFYEKLGYSLYGKLENCPPGETCYYYRKDLVQSK